MELCYIYSSLTQNIGFVQENEHHFGILFYLIIASYIS